MRVSKYSVKYLHALYQREDDDTKNGSSLCSHYEGMRQAIDQNTWLFLLFLRRSLHFKRCQFLHQAAFSTGSIVLVDNFFLSCFVQCADSLESRLSSFFQISFCHLELRFPDEGARLSSVYTVVNPALLVLSVPFNLRSDICQCFYPPECCNWG